MKFFLYSLRYKNTVSKYFQKKKNVETKKKDDKQIKRIKQQIKNRRILFNNVLLCYKYIIYNKKIK